ncbi:MAG: transporter [Sphingomonadales bacterium]|nr:transporter [Sphingomonadales bacterium]
MRSLLALLPLLLLAAPARADEAPLCLNRPGMATPPCVLERGAAAAELGLAEWDHSSDAASVQDDLTWGSLNLRLGLGGDTELEAGIAAWSTTRSLDRASGLVDRQRGVGDVTFALRHVFGGANGPVALHGYLTLPTGAEGIGADDWGAGLIVPMAFDLPHGFGLSFAPEADAAVNASGRGRHLRWGGAAGLSHALTQDLSLIGELGAWRDNDPAGAGTDARAAISLAWQVGKNWQLDAQLDLGLSVAAPRHALMAGISRRFR